MVLTKLSLSREIKMLRQILSVKGTAFTRVVPALFAYLFDRISMEQFVAYCGDRREGLRIKDIARQNGYVLKNCKLYAYACHKARLANRSLPTPKSYGVTAQDSLILKRLNLKHVDPSFKAFTLSEFDEMINSMITSSEIRNNIGKFVTKKMSFLMRSYGEKREDIESFLKEMAIIAVYKQYPRYQSYLHLVNVAKAQIHNKGQSFITSSTSKSRQCLIQNLNGGFEAVHESIDTMTELVAPIDYAAELKERITALSKIEHKLPERTKAFLLCAAGQYHEGFSTFLTCNNVDEAERISWEKYMNKVQQYFGVSPQRTTQLFSKIRAFIYEIRS